MAPFLVRLRNALRYAGAEYRRNIRRQEMSRSQQIASWAGLIIVLLLALIPLIFVIAVAWSAVDNLLGA